MNRVLLGGMGALAIGVVAAPASALSIIDARCVSVFGAYGGCVYSGNDNDVTAVEALYNATTKAGRVIDLNLIGKIDIGKIDAPATSSTFGTISHDPGNKTGTWSLPGYTVDLSR